MVDKGYLARNLAEVGKLQECTYTEVDNGTDILNEDNETSGFNNPVIRALSCVCLRQSEENRRLVADVTKEVEKTKRAQKRCLREMNKYIREMNKCIRKTNKRIQEMDKLLRKTSSSCYAEPSCSDQGTEPKEGPSSSSRKVSWQSLTDLSDLTWKHCLQAAKISSKLSTANGLISESRTELKESISALNKKLQEYKPSFFEILCSIITFSFTYFKVQLMKAALRPLQEEGLSRKKLTAR